ncbi:MAG: hypothetical protein KF802_06655 [Bdellovibrionaceae bacterium]|nr:hypothetical protein [Pseudobdellovibrionaceae bacterium]
MKSFRALFIVMLLGVTGCQPGTREVIREGGVGTKSPGTESLPAPRSGGGNGGPTGGNGGSDPTGGGNGVNNRPLESFMVDIRKDEAFKRFVLPLILKMADLYPRLSSDIYHIARERRWFVLPVALDRLPSQRLGTAFATDQMAVQTLGEIWIDQRLYEKMEIEDRGMLILHELLMGVRLMEFQDPVDECLSSVAIFSLPREKEQASPATTYQDMRTQCYKGRGFGSNRGRADQMKLADADYLAIRELGVRLKQGQGEISMEETGLWLSAKGFRRYDNQNSK